MTVPLSSTIILLLHLGADLNFPFLNFVEGVIKGSGVQHLQKENFETCQVFPGHLTKFQPITNIRTHIFWTFTGIFENLRPPLISLVPSLGRELE